MLIIEIAVCNKFKSRILENGIVLELALGTEGNQQRKVSLAGRIVKVLETNYGKIIFVAAPGL